jgi:glutamate N-acetyltransferase/amino-acid N-acetyltransferase
VSVGLKEPVSVECINGIRLATAAAGIRYQNRNDLVLIELSEQTELAAVFTRNKFRAAPVELAIQNLSKAKPRYLVINAGNANAGTGKPGYDSAVKTAQAISGATHAHSDQVLTFSTGVIGELLDADKIAAKVPELIGKLSPDNWVDAAKAIMTTDTVAKARSLGLEVGGKRVTITGIAKGAGMIQPNMATMLSYIATDMEISHEVLQQLLIENVEVSFNSITVDGDTSTNDACVLMATGNSGIQFGSLDEMEKRNFKSLLQTIMQELAQSIIRDGEGVSKFITINIHQAMNYQQAKKVAFSVANSPLVKTAIAASDPNWGRIMAAAGKVDDENLDLSRASMDINGICIWEQGCIAPGYREELGIKAMMPEEICIDINLGLGSADKTVWTTDLTQEYVRINAEYRT